MRTTARAGVVALGCLILAVVPPVSAQERFEFGPLIGVHAPLGDFRPAAYYSTALPSSPQDLTALAVGVQGRVWISSNLGVQVEGMVARRSVGGGATPGGILPTRTASVTTGTAQLLLASRPGGRPRVWVSAGGGLVGYGGAAYAQYHTRTYGALVLGMGSTLPLTPRLRLTAGGATLIYNINVRDSLGVSLERGRQVDLRLQTGITWSWR